MDLLLTLRAEARGACDYQTADSIRDGLDRLGVELRDTPDGTDWLLRSGE